MVRYPIEERRSVADLENMRIRTPAGDEVPFESVAEMSFGKGYSTITRLNRNRTVTVSADIDPEIIEPAKIIKSISEDYIPELLARYPSVSYGLEGGPLPDLCAHRDSVTLLRPAAGYHVGDSIRRNWRNSGPPDNGRGSEYVLAVRSGCARRRRRE